MYRLYIQPVPTLGITNWHSAIEQYLQGAEKIPPLNEKLKISSERGLIFSSARNVEAKIKRKSKRCICMLIGTE